jgi:hypothetical protein
MSFDMDVLGETYSLAARSFAPGTHGSYWEPPESGEVELEERVTRVSDGRQLTIDELSHLLAEVEGVDADEACATIHDMAFERLHAVLGDRDED